MGKESGLHQMGRLLVPRDQGNVNRCKLGEGAEIRLRGGVQPESGGSDPIPALRSDHNSLIILSGPASVSHPRHKSVSMGILAPYRDSGNLRHRAGSVSGWLWEAVLRWKEGWLQTTQDKGDCKDSPRELLIVN